MAKSSRANKLVKFSIFQIKSSLRTKSGVVLRTFRTTLSRMFYANAERSSAGLLFKLSASKEKVAINNEMLSLEVPPSSKSSVSNERGERSPSLSELN